MDSIIEDFKNNIIPTNTLVTIRYIPKVPIEELTEKSNDNSETTIVSEEFAEKSNDNSETNVLSEEVESDESSIDSNQNNRNEVLNTVLDTIQDLDDIKHKLCDEEYLKIANKLQFIYNKCKYITNFEKENDYWSTDDDDFEVDVESDEESNEESQPPPPYVCNCNHENFGEETFACHGDRRCFSVTEYMQCNRYKMLSTFIPDLKYFFNQYDKNIILEEGSHFIPNTYDTLIKFDINYINDLVMKMTEFGFPNGIEDNSHPFLAKIVKEYLSMIEVFYRNQKARFSIYCLNFTINILKYFTTSTSRTASTVRFANTINNKLSEFLNNEIFITVYEDEFSGKDNNFIQDWIKYITLFIEENSNSV